ncbi:hypothetical protein ACP70R_028404 [Stipagrostis hirtigluma subsp. patula]
MLPPASAAAPGARVPRRKHSGTSFNAYSGGRQFPQTTESMKRAPRCDDDGLPLSDENLLHVFSGSLGTADLVRCAATCRRWRRLVSSEAGFICRSAPSAEERHATGLAVGFFHQGAAENDGAHAPPRFVPLGQRFRDAALDAIFDGEPFRSSTVVASRKGRLVLEYRRVSRAAILRLAVCNPMTGDVSVLPALSGKDKPGHYACVLLTADDFEADAADPPRSGGSAFRLVLVYNRRNFTASRSFSSDAGAWAPEGKVSGAKITSKNIERMHRNAAVAVRGAVFWLAKCAVVGLHVGTLEATVQVLPCDYRPCLCHGLVVEKRVLTATPDGRLCVAEGWLAHGTMLRLLFGDGSSVQSGNKFSKDETKMAVRLEPPLPDRTSGSICLQGVCEKSGVVFFAAGNNRQLLYALDMEKKEARLILAAAPDGRWCPPVLGGFHAYEMDRVAYLTSLG